jgi:hypothetical protein
MNIFLNFITGLAFVVGAVTLIVFFVIGLSYLSEKLNYFLEKHKIFKNNLKKVNDATRIFLEVIITGFFFAGFIYVVFWIGDTILNK